VAPGDVCNPRPLSLYQWALCVAAQATRGPGPFSGPVPKAAKPARDEAQGGLPRARTVKRARWVLEAEEASDASEGEAPPRRRAAPAGDKASRPRPRAAPERPPSKPLPADLQARPPGSQPHGDTNVYNPTKCLVSAAGLAAWCTYTYTSQPRALPALPRLPHGVQPARQASLAALLEGALTPAEDAAAGENGRTAAAKGGARPGAAAAAARAAGAAVRAAAPPELERLLAVDARALAGRLRACAYNDLEVLQARAPAAGVGGAGRAGCATRDVQRDARRGRGGRKSILVQCPGCSVSRR